MLQGLYVEGVNYKTLKQSVVNIGVTTFVKVGGTHQDGVKKVYTHIIIYIYIYMYIDV